MKSFYLFTTLALLGIASLPVAAASTAPKLSEDAAAVKGHSRITVTAGKDLRKEELKARAYCNGGYRKELHTQKSIEVRIRNTGAETVEYKVSYYFIGKPYNGSNQPEIFDRGVKTVSCEANRNVNFTAKSKELTATDRRITSASPREKNGLEADGYLVCVEFKGEEIMSFCSRQGEKYEQGIRDRIANKHAGKDDKDQSEAKE